MEEVTTEGIIDSGEKIAIAMNMFQSIGIKVKEEKHSRLLEILFNLVKEKNDLWSFVTIKQTSDQLSKNHPGQYNRTNIKFIDCISRASGITDYDKNCIYIESPTMLEHTVLELMNVFSKAEDNVRKVVVIDSLSALMIYNDSQLLREFYSLILNRTRAQDIVVISVLIEEELDPKELMQLIQLNDKIIVERDSFIA